MWVLSHTVINSRSPRAFPVEALEKGLLLLSTSCDMHVFKARVQLVHLPLWPCFMDTSPSLPALDPCNYQVSLSKSLFNYIC